MRRTWRGICKGSLIGSSSIISGLWLGAEREMGMADFGKLACAIHTLKFE